MSKVHVFDHPLIQHKLSFIRDKRTGSKDFRQLTNEVGSLMAYEITRDLPLEDVEVETPIQTTTCKRLAGKKVVFVPILRAGLGMVDGLMNLIPSARVGHVGLYRDPETLQPHEYFVKIPSNPEERHFIVVDPMLATGGSAIAAIDSLKSEISKFVPSLLVAPLPSAKYNVCLFCSNFKAIAYSLPPLPIIKIFKNSP